MKLTILVKDIPRILESLDKIQEKDSHAVNMFGLYSAADPHEVIHRLRFIEKSNDVLYSPNGPSYSWSPIAKEVELTYDEYGVIVLILRMARNIRENKDIWTLIS
ncbi:MAG: hypothetical protein [Enterobacter phage ENC20]|nr:MAG: hypothetical protein [Enterobacter phage ENC20]